MTDFAVPHYLSEFAQDHAHLIGDAINISFSVTLFSFCPQSFPASQSFPMSWLFASGVQITGASASPLVLPMSIQNIYYSVSYNTGFPGASVAKSLPAMQESQETWVRSLGQEDPCGEGNGNSLQYSCLDNPMVRGTWQATVHEVTKSWT